MRVIQLMTGTPARCDPAANLGSAVELLWNYNCGILPVVDGNAKVIGVLTDRDICVALGTRNRLAGAISVRDVMTSPVVSCSPQDDVRDALARMARARVRRLPVVDPEGKLAGILSIDDAILHAEIGKRAACAELSSEDVVAALNEVCRPDLPAVVPKAAAA